MSRNIIKLAGGRYVSLKALSGSEMLQYREVVLTTDTHELYAGTGNGEFALLGNVTIGTKAELSSTDPVKGRLYFDHTNGIMYVGNGVGWKRNGLTIADKSALVIDEFTGELKVLVDNESVVINEENQLEVNNTDYGNF